MKNIFKKSVPLLIADITALLLIVSPVSFAESAIQSGADAAHGSQQPTNIFGNSGIFSTVTNILLFLIGVLSVIMLIIGGLRYVLSGGNSTAVTAAKNTILYAIVGVVVAILAYAIIHFVISSLAGGGTSGGTNV